MYGKNKPSAKKITAAKMFAKSYTTMSNIANLLSIEIPTAEVYVIDAYCAGAPVSLEKLAGELKMFRSSVEKISSLIESGIPSLRQIRDAAEGKVSYNQIRLVLAAIIRDELNKLI